MKISAPINPSPRGTPTPTPTATADVSFWGCAAGVAVMVTNAVTVLASRTEAVPVADAVADAVIVVVEVFRKSASNPSCSWNVLDVSSQNVGSSPQ